MNPGRGAAIRLFLLLTLLSFGLAFETRAEPLAEAPGAVRESVEPAAESPEAPEATEAPANATLSSRHSLEVFWRDKDAAKASDTKDSESLQADEPAPSLSIHPSFELVEDDETTRQIVEIRPSTGPRHFVLMVDLQAARPAERFRALPPLREFLSDRLRLGDRVTLTLWNGRRADDVEILCSLQNGEGPNLDRSLGSCFDRLAGRKSVAHRASRQRGESTRELLEEAHGALARAIELSAGTGLKTSIFYLGAADRGLALGGGGRVVVGGASGESGAQETIGSVQYLVSRPRSGPLQSLARHAGDRLAASALQASASIYPLLTGRPPLGQDAWLSDETGGRPLNLLQLPDELRRLGEELGRAYELVFTRPAPDSRFHRLALSIPRGHTVRWPKGFYAAHIDENLKARAGAAARLGGPNPLLVPDSELAARLVDSRRQEDSMRTHLRLGLKADDRREDQGGRSLNLHIAVLMTDGRLLVNKRRLPVTPGGKEVDLPLRFDLAALRLGMAARLDESEEIHVFSWPLGEEAGEK